MSVNPRLSGFWEDSRRMSYFERGDGDDEDDETVGLVAGDDEEMGISHDGRTPLDRTIDKIGMGAFPLSFVSVCVAPAEPRVSVCRQLPVDAAVAVRVR